MDMGNHLQLLLHALLMRCDCHSYECGAGRGKHFRVVSPERQVGCHCYSLSGNNLVHGREAMVLCVEIVQEAQ